MFYPAQSMTAEEEVLKLRSECRYLRQKTACLERAHLSQKKKSDRLEELLRERDKFIKELEKEKEELGKLIDELKRQRDTYKGMVFKPNCSSSQREEKNQTKGLTKENCSIGGQPDHKGYGRRLPSKEDQIKRIYFHHCPDCNTRLKRSKNVSFHTVEDIPVLEQVKTITTRYDKERQWCPYCRKEVLAVPDSVIPRSKLGMNLIITTLIHKHILRQPYKKIAEQFKIFYGLNVSAGSLTAILQRTKKWLEPEYGKLLRNIRNSPIKYADETGWRINGNNGWCWAFLTKNSVYYTIEHTRGKGVPQKILSGSKKTDVLVRDDYGGYQKLKLNHQSCWAHLLRKSHEECQQEDSSKEMLDLHEQLKTIYQLLDKTVKKPFNPLFRQKIYQQVWQRLKGIINQKYQAKDAKRIQTRIRNQNKNLLTALLFNDVPLTNNLAERIIRHMVVTRKISGGSRTDNGAETHAINMSILQTIKLRNQPLVPTLRQMLLKGLRDLP